MMKPAEIERFIEFGIVPFLAAGLCWVTGFTLSSFFFIACGAMSGCFDNWKTDRGLWMLAALFFVIFASLYLIFAYDQLVGWLNGRRALPILVAIDMFVASTVMAFLNRFLFSIGYWNWRHNSVSSR